MTAVTDTQRSLHPASGRRPVVAAVLLLVAGVTGFVGSFALVLDKFRLLESPGQALSCDVNPFIGCSPVMQSWQASLFGFPNPVIGVAAFVAPVVVALALLAGARFERWFWVAFQIGLFLAWAFVTWLFTQAVYAIGALCPWCMLVWLATIPLFWVTTVWMASRGLTTGRPGVRRAATAFLPFSWVLPAANLILVASLILLQVPRLLPTLFG